MVQPNGFIATDLAREEKYGHDLAKGISENMYDECECFVNSKYFHYEPFWKVVSSSHVGKLLAINGNSMFCLCFGLTAS